MIEFAIVVDSSTPGSADLVAQRLLDRLADPFHLDGVPLRIAASIGIALCPEHAGDTNGLLQRADVAMYAAKAAGGGVRGYDPARDQHSRERLRTLEELRDALDADQLTVHYQPQCDVATGAVVGVEALVRWQHPTRGLLYPDMFLPLVEQTGLMPALTTAVLTQAVRQCRQWRLDGLDVGVSVNLSASSLLDQRLPEQVARLLTSEDLPAHALTLELTENTLMVDADQCRRTLVTLKQLGVWLSKMTTAPATARCPTCRTCPSTSSSSTGRSCRTSSAAATPRSSAPPSTSPTRWTCGSSRRASRISSAWTCSATWGATALRATTSAGP